MADGGPDDGYAGAAVLSVDGREVPVHVLLDARHEPVDGRLHWFGRLSLDGADPELEQALGAVTGTVELRTGEHRAQARIGDVDPWGRYRVAGVGHPPYPQDDPALED